MVKWVMYLGDPEFLSRAEGVSLPEQIYIITPEGAIAYGSIIMSDRVENDLVARVW